MSFWKGLKLWQKSGLIFALLHVCIFVLSGGNPLILLVVEIPLAIVIRLFLSNISFIGGGYMFCLVGGTITYGLIGIAYGLILEHIQQNKSF